MSKPPTILQKIYAQRAQDVEAAKQTPGTTPEDIARLLSVHLAPPLIPFVDRLKKNPSDATSGMSLMAEIKRASPSKGDISLTTPVAEQALTYALAGASVISVLTEPHWFKGSLHDMLMVRQSLSSVPNRPAILRKEFILDEYQIAEARLYGADTVLLIVAMMNDELLARLYNYAHSLGMESLVEVNNADEMRRALSIGAKVIGVNNRNLHDFNVDMGTTSRLVDMVKDKDVILCALSGISTPQDVRTYKDQGVKAVLVGESLMRAKDTAAFIRELLDWPGVSYVEAQRTPIVKTTGVVNPSQAQSLVGAGASMLGLVFDPTLANAITLDDAKAIRKVFPKPITNPISHSSPQQPNVPWFHSHLSTILSQCSGQQPLLVGHFTTHPSHTLAFILETIVGASLDLVQFDGALPAEWARFVPVPVIRRFASPAFAADKAASRVAHDGPATTATIVRGINDASQINRPGLHFFALIDLTVCNGSSFVYVPSRDEPSPGHQTTPDAIPDTVFNVSLKGQGVGAGVSLKGVVGTKKLVFAGELGGKWSMPILITAGREKISADVVKETSAWGVDIEVDLGENGLEDYIQSLRA
jgi:anthranilate synthase/indole-3-glycerol phosphate synthase/phosphoribosylanthranilate isomerase